MKWFVLCLLAFIALSESVKVNYRHYKVYNVVPQSEEQVQSLLNLSNQNIHDFWSEHINVGAEVRIMVSPTNELGLRSFVSQNRLDAKIGVTDVQALIDAQLRSARPVNRNVAGNISFTTYHTLTEIYAWLDELVELYPDVVSTFQVGTSYEGRPIRGIKIDFHAGHRGDKPLIAIIEGGIHSREWISPATVTGIINEFLISTDPEVRRMAEAFEWHIVPVLNPDGYVYTFTNDRMWRKNRNPSYNTTCGSNNDLSNGVDLNRNFEFRWMTIGASNNPCDQTFAGPSPFSEPESRAMAAYVLDQKQRGEVIYYFAFHSYSQLILVPFSHASGADKLQADNYGDLFEIAIRGQDKLMAKHGSSYITGTSADVLYSISGGSFDWAKGTAEIPIAYLIELRDLGQTGFLLPAEQIIPNNEEIMEWLVEADRVTRQLHYYVDPFAGSGAGVIFSSFVLMISAVGAIFYMN